MTRCLVVEQMVHAGFTISTIAFILNRTVQAIRHLLKMSNDYYESSRAFRLSTSEATLNDNPYDAVFVANMCKADYLGSSVPDGLHLCLYVKDVIDDVDGYDGIAFNRWYADMCCKGIQVDWYNCR